VERTRKGICGANLTKKERTKEDPGPTWTKRGETLDKTCKKKSTVWGNVPGRYTTKTRNSPGGFRNKWRGATI